MTEPSAREQLDALQRRLATMERRMRLLGTTALVFGALAITGAVLPQEQVLRARGLVITDANGRERIVIGAPVSNASAHPQLVGASGLVVLDSAGLLQVAAGTNPPLVFRSGKLGKRIASSAGITIYDPRNGGERGGMGAFADGRANVCLDYGTKDKEAACMSVAPEDRYAAVILNGTPNEPQYDRVTMYVGADGGGSIKAFGGGANTGGVMIHAGKGPATVTYYDTAGKAIPAKP